jgi:threonine aldolase
VAGARRFIDEALRVRKVLGGGMRQAGVLAAAGLIALEKHPAKLAADHENARFLAEGLCGLNGVKVDLATVQTNIVIFDVGGTGLTAGEFSARLKALGVLINPINATQMRLVTHSDASREDCARALEAIRNVASGTA